MAYFSTSLYLCSLLKVTPVILLHPLDFMAADEVPELANFPGFGTSTDEKIEFTARLLEQIDIHFETKPLSEFATEVASRVTRIRRLRDG